ncbi:unnamed protein product, partial [Ectocarpus fasciculatus]
WCLLPQHLARGILLFLCRGSQHTWDATKTNLTTPGATTAVFSVTGVRQRAPNPPLRPPPVAACQFDSAVMIEYVSTNQRRRFDDACRCDIKRRQLLPTAPTTATQAPSARRARDGLP